MVTAKENPRQQEYVARVRNPRGKEIHLWRWCALSSWCPVVRLHSRNWGRPAQGNTPLTLPSAPTQPVCWPLPSTGILSIRLRKELPHNVHSLYAQYQPEEDLLEEKGTNWKEEWLKEFSALSLFLPLRLLQHLVQDVGQVTIENNNINIYIVTLERRLMSLRLSLSATNPNMFCFCHSIGPFFCRFLFPISSSFI